LQNAPFPPTEKKIEEAINLVYLFIGKNAISRDKKPLSPQKPEKRVVTGSDFCGIIF
jgi:hypothetical protein